VGFSFLGIQMGTQKDFFLILFFSKVLRIENFLLLFVSSNFEHLIHINVQYSYKY
jgi:hypothetical protein